MIICIHIKDTLQQSPNLRTAVESYERFIWLNDTIVTKNSWK